MYIFNRFFLVQIILYKFYCKGGGMDKEINKSNCLKKDFNTIRIPNSIHTSMLTSLAFCYAGAVTKDLPRALLRCFINENGAILVTPHFLSVVQTYFALSNLQLYSNFSHRTWVFFMCAGQNHLTAMISTRMTSTYDICLCGISCGRYFNFRKLKVSVLIIDLS